MEIQLTTHSIDRAKERLSWNEKILFKMAEIAYDKGLKHSETKGRLKKYIDKLWLTYRTANNIRIYGENIFLFSSNKLITVYQLDNNLKSHAKL